MTIDEWIAKATPEQKAEMRQWVKTAQANINAGLGTLRSIRAASVKSLKKETRND